jgi:hypothetical protein
MKRLRRWLWPLVLIALGVWFWRVLFPGPETIIRKQLAQLARAASFPGNESPLAAAHHAATLAGFFSVNAEVILNVPGEGAHTFTGREEIQQAALFARSHLRALTVEFLDADVTVAPDRLSATVDLTARVRSPREPDFYVQEMRFLLKQINGEWRIVRAETVKTLSRAGRARRVGRRAPTGVAMAGDGRSALAQ